MSAPGRQTGTAAAVFDGLYVMTRAAADECKYPVCNGLCVRLASQLSDMVRGQLSIVCCSLASRLLQTGVNAIS
jgi:hypothetical protein